MSMAKIIRLLFFSLLLNLAACTTKTLTKQPVSGISWVDTAAEYDALALQTFQNATSRLEGMIADQSWSAIPGQSGTENMPTAIILDVDETSISNIKFQLELDGNFSHEKFDHWQQNNPAGRMPGAAEFIQTARDKNVAVFFITNRPCEERGFAPGPCPQEDMTIQDLSETGIESDADHVLLVGEQAAWTREKRSRQLFVARTHRVIMLFGDDLGDFLPCVRAKPVAPCQPATADDRARLVLQHREYWGAGWFILPNPMHGSWSSFISSVNPDN